MPHFMNYKELSLRKEEFFKNLLKNQIELLWEEIVFRRVVKDGLEEDRAIEIANEQVGKTVKERLENAQNGNLDRLQGFLEKQTQSRLKKLVKSQIAIMPEESVLLPSLDIISDSEIDYGGSFDFEEFSCERNPENCLFDEYAFIVDYYNFDFLERKVKNYVLSLQHKPLLQLDHSFDPPFDNSGRVIESNYLIDLNVFTKICELYPLYNGNSRASYLSGCGLFWDTVREDCEEIINSFIYDLHNLTNKETLITRLKEIDYDDFNDQTEDDREDVIKEFICESALDHYLLVKFGKMSISSFCFL
ncbi:hypothetical protein [Desulfobacter latus]|uniref:Uncharacterized protein n=1 Tax=Desulfobacter latus TaxID=2292 RepID=A0A850TBZ6_9BACT|nr:hypothetical protein [Desulfobacter latus]NWH06218.1 hypothetical protein [Desulfobacter latus]